MPSIIQATLTDVKELNTLINSAYRGDTSKKGWTTEADLLDGTRIDEATLTQYLEDPASTILKYVDDSGKIQGCVNLNLADGKVYVGMLTVNPELQNAGIGRQLLEASELFAQKAGSNKLWMTVITIRTELIAYYERKGYVITGEKKPFHTDPKFGIQKQPIELLVMEKMIN